MLINQPMIDWVTLTTFDKVTGSRWLDFLNFAPETIEEQRRLQYKGLSAGPVFAGEATQRGKPHWMLQVSGEKAHDIVTDGIQPDSLNFIRCTRIDLQVTIAKPETYDSRAVYDEIVAWETDGRKRQCSIVQSGDGLDTIYIGNRASDRFTRLYVKEHTQGHAIRFETEFKGDHAKSIFTIVSQNEKRIGTLLASEIRAMPELQNGLLNEFLRFTGQPGRRNKPERVYAQTGGLRWLRAQVTPAIMRLMNSHDEGPYVRQLVRSWAAEADSIDRDQGQSVH